MTVLAYPPDKLRVVILLPGASRCSVKVGSFCCPVLPVPLESPSVARRGPTALLSL